MKPFISVIVTAYNRKGFLNDSLSSLLNQKLSLEEFEVILVTNFQFNLEPFKDLNLKHYVLDDGPPGEYMLKGINSAQGDVLCFLDDDDIFGSEKLLAVKDVFKNYTDVGYLRHNFVEIDKHQVLKNRDSVRKLRKTRYISSLKFRDNLIYLIFNEISFNASTISIRSDLLDKHTNRFFFAGLPPDDMLWMIGIAKSKAVFLDERCFSYYRIHSESVIHSQTADRYKCVESSKIKFLNDFVTGDRNRDAIFRYMLLKEEVENALFCQSAFSIKHYIMSMMMILFSDHR